MNKTKKTPRLRYYIRSGLQLKFVRINILLVIFISIAIAYSIYQLSINILGPNLEEVYPPGLLKEIYNNFYNAFGIRLLFIISFVVIIIFFVSHQVAGPAYHIERDLTTMAEGDLTKRIYLRKHDELKPIAKKLNKMADFISQKLDSIKKNLEITENLSEEIRRGELDLSRRQDISEKLAVSLKEIKNILTQFKI